MEKADPTLADLSKLHSNGDVTLFIGAGLSIGAGLPGWGALIRPLAQSVGYRLPDDDEFIAAEHLLTAAQHYENKRSRNNLIQHLRDNLDTASVQPTPVHHLATSLPVQVIFTTNYDNLIEIALRGASQRFNVIVSEPELALWSEDRVQIVKLCGDLQRPESIIITKGDFNTYFATHPRLVERLRTTLESKTALFLGYSLQDPFFNQIWDHVGLDFGRLRRAGYAVLFDVDPLEADDLRQRGIQVINLETRGHDRTALMKEWLEALVAESKSSDEPKAWSTSSITRPMSEVDEVIDRLRRIEQKLDRGRAEDRQTAAQILNAIAQNQVEQAEAAQMVAELRAWMQRVQQAGLPLDPDVRAALDALAEHTAGVYQYLHLALPIIPGILSYNVELGSEHRLDLKALWERVKPRLGAPGAKGDGAVSTPAQQVINTGKAWAVLIGINEYEDPYIADLKVCVDDVTAVHQSLDPGYQVAKLLTDATPDRLPTRANVLGELSAVSQAADAGDLLLFYFSGHGIAWGGESYLLSRDTRLSALKHTAVAMRDVRELMEQSPARAKVIVLDACHSGASIGKAEPTMTPEFIRRVFEEAEGMAVLASCKQGQQSWEWAEKSRSVFTYYLLEALAGQADLDQKGFVTVSDASRYVTDGVKRWATQEGVPQTPTLQYTVVGDIVLVRY